MVQQINMNATRWPALQSNERIGICNAQRIISSRGSLKNAAAPFARALRSLISIRSFLSGPAIWRLFIVCVCLPRGGIRLTTNRPSGDIRYGSQQKSLDHLQTKSKTKKRFRRMCPQMHTRRRNVRIARAYRGVMNAKQLH